MVVETKLKHQPLTTKIVPLLEDLRKEVAWHFLRKFSNKLPKHKYLDPSLNGHCSTKYEGNIF